MTSQYRHRRTSNPSTAFPNPLEPGEIAVNSANRSLAVGDANSGSLGAPLPLLAIKIFDARAIYALNDFVTQAGVLYRAKNANGPGAFNSNDWLVMVGALDPQYVQKAGDTMTGMLTLPATLPTLGTHATNKTYVDNQLAAKSSVIVSDTPPPGVIDNTLWWESDTGLLYVKFNDGNSSQWVIACPQPDISQFVAKTGDTMTGPLVVPSPPTAPGHAASKAYVDSGDAAARAYADSGDTGMVKYTAQTLTPAQRSQARSNIDVTKKNYIINGAMMVSQENGGTAGTGGSFFPVDGWSIGSTGTTGAWSIAQIASATAGGSLNRIRWTVTTADATVSAAKLVYIWQRIEGLRIADLLYGAANAKTVTLQFGVKAPAGTYCVAIVNAGNNRSYVAEYVIAAGEANTDVVKSVTIPGDVTGTWAKDNTMGMDVRFGLMVGSTYQMSAGSWQAANGAGSSNQFNAMGTVNNIFELFDVSLTEGTAAPPFMVPDYASELAACQRYYEKTWDDGIKVGTGGSNYGYDRITLVLSVGVNFDTLNQGKAYSWKVAKRANPSVTGYSANSGVINKATDFQNSADVPVTISSPGNTGCIWAAAPTVVARGIALGVHLVANARL